jgi:hypothetical protein
MTAFATNTIGPGWSPDPEERQRQVAAQERLVSSMCDILDQIPEWELEAACKRESDR